jgi:hypothetical protein
MLKPYKTRWVKKGRRTPTIAALEQARVHVALAREHQAALADRGWSEERTELLETRVEALDERYSHRSFSADASRGATQNEMACRQQAKELIQTLQLAVPMILREHPVAGITEDAFRVGEPLRNSTTRISKYLMRVRPFVVALEEHLAPYFAKESPTERLESVKAALDASDTAQETARGGLPTITLEIYELTGEILEMLEDMSRIARIAFRDRPDIALRFRKALIQRALRSGRKAEVVEEVEENEEAAPENEEVGEIDEAV